MRGDPIPVRVLSARLIPNADPALLKSLDVPEGLRSLALFTSDCDDVSYAALDEATKKADVRVVYAKSMYAGASNASTANAGEFIGILAAPDPAAARSGLDAAVHFARQEASFKSASDRDDVVYFAHCISRTGSYLSAQAGVPEGTAMAYLIAPPLEGGCGAGRRAEDGGGGAAGVLRPPHGDQLRRRAFDRLHALSQSPATPLPTRCAPWPARPFNTDEMMR